MTDYARIHAVVKGVVQGVGFRFFVVHVARRYGLTGWVRNLGDGSVEVVAEGDNGLLNDFVGELRIGPSAAHVTNVIVTPGTYRGDFDRFDVRY
jgi:acylphosphatase